MSSVWSASMSNGVSDLACHMCLSAYELTGRDGGRRVRRPCTGPRQLDKQQPTSTGLESTPDVRERLEDLLLLSDTEVIVCDRTSSQSNVRMCFNVQKSSKTLKKSSCSLTSRKKTSGNQQIWQQIQTHRGRVGQLVTSIMASPSKHWILDGKPSFIRVIHRIK